uniref:Uncharacterized protein n=1 Tax=Arundo donax TaxID=35708 RepID=A0A0A9BTI2_ARUDO
MNIPHLLSPNSTIASSSCL